MFGDLKKKQEEIELKLQEYIISESIENHSITVEMNAKGDVINLSIDKDKIDFSDIEIVEDLLVEVLRRAKNKADDKQAEIQASLVNDMLPGGMDLNGLKDLF